MVFMKYFSRLYFLNISVRGQNQHFLKQKWISMTKDKKFNEIVYILEKKRVKMIRSGCFFYNKKTETKRNQINCSITELSRKKEGFFRILFRSSYDFFFEPLKLIYKKAIFLYNKFLVRAFPFTSIFNTRSFFLRFYFTSPHLHQKDQLWNDILHLVIISKKNFPSYVLKIETVSFLTSLSKSIWMLDGQYEKFLKRKIHGGKIIAPPFFIVSFFAKKSYTCLWNKVYHLEIALFPKRKSKILKENELQKGYFYLKTMFKREKFFLWTGCYQSGFTESLGVLSESFRSYADYNRVSLQRIEKNHSRDSPRSVEKFTCLKTIEPCEKKFISFEETISNQLLFKKLEASETYDPVTISRFLPLDKIDRCKILDKLVFPFPVELLEFTPGGNKKKIVICWKIPYDKEQRSFSTTRFIIAAEKKKFPLYFSRSMLSLKKNKKKV